MNGMTIFTGFDGAGLGMKAAGLDVVAGIELDPEIAEVARANGLPVKTADVTKEDPGNYIGIEALHASLPCPNFTTAKANRAETKKDIDLAQAVCRFIEALRPVIFTLENVWAYRQSRSWALIEDTLFRLGYLPDVQHLNAADFGVPQTRKRMIVRAVRGSFAPALPSPVPWVGWYEAIEDLIPTLPESQFAPWQLERLPEEIKTWLVGNDRNGNERDHLNRSEIDDPAFTITSSNGTKLKAYLVNTREMHHGEGITAVSGDTPAYTLPATSTGDRHKAFIVPGGNATSFDVRSADEPVRTIGDTERVGNIPRAWLSQGRVVKMTPRALARFQAFQTATNCLRKQDWLARELETPYRRC